ncbi:MAG TPA: hypothetical protein VMU92_06935 [Acidobacteriaceae bacterium]|nr:hypothetical protein [Acidobacteriaceae bacterium]
MGRAYLAVFLLAAASAQTVPVLHKRSSDVAAPPQTQAAKGYSTLPARASGEYELDDDGSIVQITIQDNRLTGYITKMQDSAALTLFFLKTSIQGSRVSFITSTVHNMHYIFKGEIVRGNAATPDQRGFYQMVGELTEYRGDVKRRRKVYLKSTPRN